MAIKLIVSSLCAVLCFIFANYVLNGTINSAYVHPAQIVFLFVLLGVSSYFAGRYILMFFRPTIFTLNTQFLNLKGYLKPLSPYQDIIIEFDRIREIRLKQSQTISRCVIRTIDQEEFPFGDLLSLAEQRWLIFEIQEFMEEIKSRVFLERQANLELLKDRNQNGLDLLLNQGIDKYRWQKIDEAKLLFNAAVLLDSKCAEAYNNLGVISHYKKNYAEAIKAFQKALQLIPGYWAARMNLLTTYKKLGNQQKLAETQSIRPVFGSRDGIHRYTLVLRDSSSGEFMDVLSSFIEGNLINQGKIATWQREFILRHLQKGTEGTSDFIEKPNNFDDSVHKESEIPQRVADTPVSFNSSSESSKHSDKLLNNANLPSQKVSIDSTTPMKKRSPNSKQTQQTASKSFFSQMCDRLDQIMTTKRGFFLVSIVSVFLTLKILPTFLIWVWFLLPIGGMIYRTARLKGNKFKIFGSSFLIAILSIIVPRNLMAELRYTAGNVMEPTLPDQSRIVVDKTSYITTNPLRGDIVIFKMASIYFPDSTTSITFRGSAQDVKVSRIIGFPGETVEIKNGQLLINGQQQPESYLGMASTNTLTQYNLKAFKVPRDFLLYKDDFSSFQREQPPLGEMPSIGLIPRNSVIGKATAIFYPFGKSRRL